MQRFFDSIESIETFTHSLDCQIHSLECTHCFKKDQFVSHGFIYKQRSSILKEPIGKRIFCSNRYGRSGCGRTFQLYICEEIPSFHYNATHLFVFIASLFANMSITQSYQESTGTEHTRQAWRWMNKLMRKLGDYRSFLVNHSKNMKKSFLYRAHRLQHLLPTLDLLNHHACKKPCQFFQHLQQQAFL